MRTEFGSTECKPGEVQTGRCTTASRTPRTTSSRTTTRCGSPTSRQSTTTRCSSPTRASPSARAPTCRGPDGKPGIDISGYTMKNMDEEMSHGAYTVHGSATPWATLPHSEAFDGASTPPPEPGRRRRGRRDPGHAGHPDNPIGRGPAPARLRDGLSAGAADFPWADYDIEDQDEGDGDGDFLEPDGVIDHVVLVHAGEDKSGGGGAEGTYAIWAPRRWSPAARPSPAPTSSCRTRSCEPQSRAWLCSRTSTATTSACPTCTTPAVRATPTSTSGTSCPRALTWDRSSSRCRRTWASGTSGCSAGPTRWS